MGAFSRHRKLGPKGPSSARTSTSTSDLDIEVDWAGLPSLEGLSLDVGAELLFPSLEGLSLEGLSIGIGIGIGIAGGTLAGLRLRSSLVGSRWTTFAGIGAPLPIAGGTLAGTSWQAATLGA